MKTTKVLVCNVGSTSLKFKLYLMPEKNLLAEGKIERVGTEEAIYYYGNPDRNLTIYEEQQLVPDYLNGVQRFLNDLTGEETGAIRHVEEIEVVGFKTVLAKNYYGVHELSFIWGSQVPITGHICRPSNSFKSSFPQPVSSVPLRQDSIRQFPWSEGFTACLMNGMRHMESRGWDIMVPPMDT